VIDDFETGFRERLAPFDGRIELVEADVRDGAALDRRHAVARSYFHQAVCVRDSIG